MVRIALGLVASVFLVTAAIAEPITLVISSARADHDQRFGKPVLTITVTPASKQAIGHLSQNNVGRKNELRVDGKTILTSFFREPLLGGQFQIGGDDMTDDRAQALAEQLSKPGVRVEVEVVPD